MIWYFIAGFVSGAVGVILYGRHIAKKIEGDRDNEIR